MLWGALGKNYLGWNNQAYTDLIKPGKGKLTAEFWLSDDTVEQIKAATDSGDKHFPQFLVHIKDSQNQIVAEVNRTVYVRKKAKYRPD